MLYGLSEILMLADGKQQHKTRKWCHLSSLSFRISITDLQHFRFRGMLRKLAKNVKVQN